MSILEKLCQLTGLTGPVSVYPVSIPSTQRLALRRVEASVAGQDMKIEKVRQSLTTIEVNVNENREDDKKTWLDISQSVDSVKADLDALRRDVKGDSVKVSSVVQENQKENRKEFKEIKEILKALGESFAKISLSMTREGVSSSVGGQGSDKAPPESSRMQRGKQEKKE